MNRSKKNKSGDVYDDSFYGDDDAIDHCIEENEVIIKKN